MGVFINGIGNVSPQNTFGSNTFLENILASSTKSRFNCVEPDYAAWIDPKAMRRMSRVIRMGVAAGGLALKEAGVTRPDGIITGTGYGCLEDTGIFLSKMIVNDEQSLNPTPFIQSTHNSIGSQIGLLLQCQGYNQTYVQGSLSMEASFMDALLTVKESTSQNLLVGGVDEVTDISHSILSRLGLYNHGAKQGEGATYFLLSTDEQESTYAELKDVRMIYNPANIDDVREKIIAFIRHNSISFADIDLVLLGNNGDPRFDKSCKVIAHDLWRAHSVGTFKNLCGEYPTSTGFATWLASMVLKSQRVPGSVANRAPSQIRNVLIFNPYFDSHYSLILLQSAKG